MKESDNREEWPSAMKEAYTIVSIPLTHPKPKDERLY
jgi:hypothetical protein